jgi:hypothetical protein
MRSVAKSLDSSAYLARRHDFDELADLPVRHVVASPAVEGELGALVGLATNAIPSLAAAEPIVRQVHRHNSDSIWSVCNRNGAAVGVFAMLLLNRRGLRSMLSGRFDSAAPELDQLAGQGEGAAAVYLWAIVTPGLAIEAFRAVSHWLRSPRMRSADIFARPATEAGLRLSLRLGFEPIPEIGLYCFRRHWNRRETSAVA